MKTTSLKTIYLTKDELKKAVADFVSKSDKGLSAHIRKSVCQMQWNQAGTEFVISVDNEIKDKVLPSTHGMSRILRIAERSMEKHASTIDRILDMVEGRHPPPRN